MQTTHVMFPGLLLMLPLLLLGLIVFAFWVWMLIDCLTNEALEGNERLVWVLVIALTHFVGAVIYFFVGRPKRTQAGLPPPQLR
jgi:hypothetical protein